MKRARGGGKTKRHCILGSLVGGVLLMLGACAPDEDAPQVQHTEDRMEATTEEDSRKDADDSEATEGTSKEALLDQAEGDLLMKNYYLESKVTMYTDEETDETVNREWFYWKDGALNFRKEIERAGAPTQYITGNDTDSTIYTEGEDIAIRTETLVPGADQPSASKVLKTRIESYRMSHESELVGQEDVNGRKGHHLIFTPKDEESGTTLELWIDSEHWLTLKEVLDQGDMRMEYEVTGLVEGIEPSMDLFHLTLPEGVTIIDQ